MNRDKQTEQALRLASLIGEADDAFIEAADPAAVRGKRGFTVTRALRAASYIVLVGATALLLPRLIDMAECKTADGAAPECDNRTAYETALKGEPSDGGTPNAGNTTGNGSAVDSGAAGITGTETGAVADPKCETPSDDQELTEDKTDAESTVEPDLNGTHFVRDEREKNDKTVLEEENAYIWRWEDMTDAEIYLTVTLDGREYRAAGTKINASYRDETLGMALGIGYDPMGEEEVPLQQEMPAFSVKGIAGDRLISVYIEDEDCDYLYTSDAYEPPATLGDLIDIYDMTTYLPLTAWHEGSSDVYYALGLHDDSPALWEKLSALGDAPYRENLFHESGGETIVFGVCREEPSMVYGAEKRVFSISDDGYIRTNIFGWGYAYDIGADAAKDLIAWIKDNAVGPYDGNPEKPEELPAVIGVVTEVTDNGDGTYRMTVDDSILQANPAEGIIFTAVLDTRRVTRYIKNGIIRVGDTVRVVYERYIDRETMLIDSVTGLAEVIVTDGEVLIPE